MPVNNRPYRPRFRRTDKCVRVFSYFGPQERMAAITGMFDGNTESIVSTKTWMKRAGESYMAATYGANTPKTREEAYKAFGHVACELLQRDDLSAQNSQDIAVMCVALARATPVQNPWLDNARALLAKKLETEPKSAVVAGAFSVMGCPKETSHRIAYGTAVRNKFVALI